MGDQEPCDTALALGLRGDVGIFSSSDRGGCRRKKPPVQFHVLFPTEEEEERGLLAGEEQGASRLRLRNSEEGDTVDRKANEGSACNDSRGGGGGGGGRARKKLRLSEEQSALLENTFHEHRILTVMQKQELADKLNLRPRQVEVWFQNRRARTKVKQTEVDCEFLKKCCESLSDENRRLKKELQELRSIKARSPFYVQLPKAATLTMCPSCERIASGDVGKATGGGFDAIAAVKPGLYSCTVTDKTMAC